MLLRNGKFRSNVPAKPSSKVYLLTVRGATRRFQVDRRFAAQLGKLSWRWVPAAKAARATLGFKQPREFLHRYIVRVLLQQDWQEVFFNDGDRYNCLAANLRPYDRAHDGAVRNRFKNNTSGHRGVSYKATTQRWYAVIRVRGKVRHLGYFDTAEQAARAYSREWKLAHPNKFLKS